MGGVLRHHDSDTGVSVPGEGVLAYFQMVIHVV